MISRTRGPDQEVDELEKKWTVIRTTEGGEKGRKGEPETPKGHPTKSPLLSRD